MVVHCSSPLHYKKHAISFTFLEPLFKFTLQQLRYTVACVESGFQFQQSRLKAALLFFLSPACGKTSFSVLQLHEV